MFTSLILAVAVAAPGAKAEAKKEAPSPVGLWTVKESINRGQAIPVPDGSSVEFTADGQCLFNEPGEAKPQVATYTTDPKKEPAQIDLTWPGGGKMKDLVAPGMYKIDGDTLVIVFGLTDERPTAFESKAGSAAMLMTLKRMKKD